uniref:C2H2-type domain-containing protein n=1 Tax=Poecilia mexicana TaxID=48701 RepID=A0A3B3WD60_9TELE
MLSDELDSKPELLVQFVQNASIPLVQSLEDSESKHSCLPLLPDSSSSLPEFGGVPQQSPLVVQSHAQPPAPQSPPAMLHDLQQPDSTSYVLLNLAKGITASSESLIFAADGAVDDEDEGVSSGDYGMDGSAPWYLRVQELAHDSLIAATRAQLARDAKANQDARAADERELPPRPGRPLSKQVLRCSFEGCGRTFTWRAHLKYHLKTHRNDRMFQCSAEGCGKSFYVLQRLQVHMRTHNGEKPFICKEKNCGKKFTTAGNLKNHRRIHTGGPQLFLRVILQMFRMRHRERWHLFETPPCLPGEKPHMCGICGKTFSQSGSRNVHMRKRHGEEGLAADGRETGLHFTHGTHTHIRPLSAIGGYANGWTASLQAAHTTCSKTALIQA